LIISSDHQMPVSNIQLRQLYSIQYTDEEVILLTYNDVLYIYIYYIKKKPQDCIYFKRNCNNKSYIMFLLFLTVMMIYKIMC
jgi:hypothetical protein